MIPALFVLGGLCVAGGILLHAWNTTATDDTLADIDAPVPYLPAVDDAGLERLHAAVTDPDWEQHVSDALDAANVFTEAEIDHLRALAAADAAGAQR